MTNRSAITRYHALATDYDDTIATAGVVSDATCAALERARADGFRVILVTGRELTDLERTFPHTAVFDRIVAENGAVLHTPHTGETQVLAEPPPAALIAALRSQGVPLAIGCSIVATVEPYEHAALSAIRDLGLEWHVIFNKGSVMMLPSGVNKATGLAAALEQLAIAPAATIAFGDAENDHAFMGACGLAVAVGNALPSVKQLAHVVLEAPNGRGIAAFIDRLRAGHDVAAPVTHSLPNAPGT